MVKLVNLKMQQQGEPQFAAEILAALGGKDNLATLTACATRLRVVVGNARLVDETALRQLGAAAVVRVGAHAYHAVFGLQAAQLCSAIQTLLLRLASEEIAAVTVSRCDAQAVYAPVSGKVVLLSEVPDLTFAEKLLGDGFAIWPDHHLIVAPVSGRVTSVLPTKHALTLLSDSGLEVFIHVGLGTARLNGAGFEALVAPDDTVVVGTPLLKVDLEYVGVHAKSLLTPVSIMNCRQYHLEIYPIVADAGKSIACVAMPRKQNKI